MGGATWYNNRRGQSVYPIVPGYVVRYLQPQKVYNAWMHAYAEHHVFVWIQCVSDRRKGERAQDVLVKRFMVWIPMIVGSESHVLTSERWSRKRSLTKHMKQYGYTVVADDVRWHRTRRSAKRFYRVVQEHLGIKLL